MMKCIDIMKIIWEDNQVGGNLLVQSGSTPTFNGKWCSQPHASQNVNPLEEEKSRHMETFHIGRQGK